MEYCTSTFGSGMLQREQVLDCAGTASVLCSVVDKYVPDTKNKLDMMRSRWMACFCLLHILSKDVCVGLGTLTGTRQRVMMSCRKRQKL